MTTDVSTLGSGHARPVGAAAGSPWLLGRPRWLSSRLLWLVPGFAIGVYANLQASEHGIGLMVLLAFGLAPHLPIVLGFGQPHARGQMAPRAVPLFNVLHHPLPPLLVLGLAATGVLSPFWFVAALAWFSHIVADLAFGHGLRTADGWRRPWWALR
jgi:hypothetical protein